jgi:peptidoglycan/xylan/chitin deacetylase (PgdA/CDA1 family)
MTRVSLKHAVKVTVAYLLYYGGLLHLWQAVALRRRSVVLMYHRVLTDEEKSRTGSHPGIIVGQETFARQMAVLKGRFQVLSLSEFAQHIERRSPFPDSSCLITFDDGWEDNYTHALPVLAQHSLPALVFLPVNFIGQRRLFWREALTHVIVEAIQSLRRSPDRRARIAAQLAPLGLASTLEAVGDPRPTVIEAVNDLDHPMLPAVETVLTALSAELGLKVEDLPTPDRFCNWAQVELMSQRGVDFGGHGADHRVLTDVTEEHVRHELARSKATLDERFPAFVPTFSYPSGKWTRAIVADVQRAQFRLAFTTQPGFVGCNDDPFVIRRVNIHESATSSTPMFLARLLGLF